MPNRTDAEQAILQAARMNFWVYNRLTSPDFYKKDRAFLKDLSKKLQWFVEESDAHIMVINMPPRHGKSRTATKFTQWLFGRFGKSIKVMTGSYNETLSETFARSVRDTIAEEPADNSLVYGDIFTDIKIKRGDSAVKKWTLDGSPQVNYLATSPSGTATGFGCTVMIIDDLIKSAEEAYNENTLQKLIDWYNNTMLSRTEGDYKIIVIMTRWSTQDLAGYILENEENVVHINYKAVQEDGSMLCDGILSKEDFIHKTKNMNPDIIAANYQQEPIDVKGRLYPRFKTYIHVPMDENGNEVVKYRLNYTDTADTGADSLCSICYDVGFDGYYYIKDVLFSADPMEVTEPATAAMLRRNNTGTALIESNNGGRGFARQVERHLKNTGCRTVVSWFHQSANKKARILSNSSAVMEYVLFPEGWERKWPEFADALRKYQKEGNNAHDDAPDCLTGVFENPKPRGSAQLKTYRF